MLLSLSAAQAQGLPAGWTAVPCDVNGNTNGTTGFQETQSGTITRSGAYQDIYTFVQANPDYYDNGSYDTAAAYLFRPTYLNDGSTVPVGSIGVGSNSDYGSEDGMQARNFDYDGGITNGFFSAPGYNNEVIGGSLATDVSAGLTVYFKCVWQGSGPQPAYPASMSLKVTTTVTTTGTVSYGRAGETSGLIATANASDSLGDTLSASVMSPTDTSPPPLVTSYIVHASIDSGTGIASTGFSGQAQMTVSNMVPYTDYPYGRGTYTDYSVANANATITAQAGPDSRAVAISANVDATNAKSPVYNADGSVQFDAYNNIVFVPVPHTPSADGTMYGDYGIGYGSSYIPGDPDPDDLYPVKYTANLAGAWGADSIYHWYSSLKSSGGGGPTFTNVYIGTAVLPTDALPLINPGETGSIDHIHLTVTDSNDGAKGTGDYYMALHQPDNFLPSNQATETIFKKQEEVETSAPGWATPGVGANCTWNSPGAYWDYLGGGADAMAEIPGVDETLPWFGLFCASAGIAIDHLKPLPCTGPASFDPQQPGSEYPDEALHPFATTDHRDFVMIPHFYLLYTRTHLLHDVWNTTGFVSETPINSDVFVRQAGCYGTYKYQITQPAAR